VSWITRRASRARMGPEIRRFFRALSLLLFAFVAAGLAGRAAPARPPSVLFVGGCGFEVARRLAAAGFALDAAAVPEETPLSAERLKRYNVVVIQGLGRANADLSLNRVNTETVAALRGFLAAGGGVLVVPSFGQMVTQKPSQDAFLKPLGLTPLFEEWALDSRTSVTATPWKIPFARTSAIAPSPITEGVRTLWYPVPQNRIGGQNHNLPLSHDGSWTVVVQGSPSSFTRTGPLQADPPTQPGQYASSVPLVALKQAEKGRLVYLGITPEYLFGANATTTLEGIVLEHGLQGVPSNGYRLVENALRWLAAPSLDQGTLGGAAHNRALEENPYRTRFQASYVWPATPQFPSIEPAYPGVIGARSSASGGRATAAEWVRRAKARGLAFLVFLEEFPRLPRESFDRLKAECARLASREFTAIPGFVIDDEIGNHYFYFGTTLLYPDGQFLSPDGKTLVSHDPQVDAKNPYLKGQLAMTTLDYAYSRGSFRLTAGNYLLGNSAAPFADWFSDWDAFGVVTANGGQVVEDATRAYLKLVAVGEGPLPLVINRMDDPAQLDLTKWRTVLRLPARGGDIIGQRLGPDTKIADYFNEWHHYPDNPSKLFVTSGPEIETWRYTGPRDYEGSLPGEFVWQNYRWILNGRVRSAVGSGRWTFTTARPCSAATCRAARLSGSSRSTSATTGSTTWW
jgi:hypothetical protein